MVRIPRQTCAGLLYRQLRDFVAGDLDMTAEKSVEKRMLATAQKAKREQDAIAALKEYHAERARGDANRLRLRALRLAKEAADAKVLVAPVKKKPS
jgi:hypothetical protein